MIKYLSAFIFLLIISLFSVYYGANDFIAYNIRLPRVLSAIAAGAALGIAGFIMQVVLKNDLASPFTLGITHGALFGVSLSVVFGIGSVFLFSFLGAFIVIVFILAVAFLRRLSSQSIILSGIAISALFGAGSMFLQYFADESQLANIVIWSFGDLSKGDFFNIFLLFFMITLSLVFFLINSWNFNALSLECAKNVGVKTETLIFISMIIVTLLSALVVANYGIIGFVGLVAPHIVRFFENSFKSLLILSALYGAILLVISDYIARNIIYPVEIPVGIVTSFIGAPMFLYLLMRKK
ncbi:FecCD family ABC transporter permease [Caminibacter pacificus]